MRCKPKVQADWSAALLALEGHSSIANSVAVEPPVIQGKSRNVRDVLFCICGMVLDILSIVVGRGLEDLVSLSYLHWY